MLKNLKTTLWKRVYSYQQMRSRKRFVSEDLEYKRANITKQLDKDDLECINSIWGDYSSRINMDWFALYKSIGHEYDLKLYIPDDFYYMYIDAFFAKRNACLTLDDKNLYDLLFYDVPQPPTVARKIGDVYLASDYSKIDYEEFVRLCMNGNKIVLKLSVNSVGGQGIKFFDAETDSIETLRNHILSSDNLVVQEVIKQHAELGRLHPESINTIRIITLVFGEVHVLSCVLRMGIGGSRVDNASSGGIVCGIEPSGRLKPEAFDTKANRYEAHPSGVRFESVSVPGFDRCLEMCKKLAYRLVSCTKLVSWDLAIDEEGNPVLLEANLCFGEVDFHQMCNGPILGELTPKVLEYVCKNNTMLK